MNKVYHPDWPKLALQVPSKANEVPPCLFPFSHKKKKMKKYILYVSLMVVLCHNTQTEVRGQLVALHFYVGSRDPTQVTRVVGQEPLAI